MSNEDKITAKELLSKILRGEIVCWEQLEITSTLYDFNITHEFLIYALKTLNPHFDLIIFVDFLKNTVRQNDYIDRFFEHKELIDTFLLSHKSEYYNLALEKFDRFDVMEILKSVDNRNPRYMLKYILGFKYSKNLKLNDNFKELYHIIKERTALRSKHGPLLFKPFQERLEMKFEEMLVEEKYFK